MIMFDEYMLTHAKRLAGEVERMPQSREGSKKHKEPEEVQRI
jgi:hypothetical protein